MGWTPSITVQRDSHRRIIGYQAEPEWDETERDWMRALAAYEQTLCPLCGLPRDICQSPDAEFNLHAETSICWASTHMQEAMRRWQKANKDSPSRDSLVAHLTD